MTDARGAHHPKGEPATAPRQEGDTAKTPGGSTRPHDARSRGNRRERTRTALLAAAERLWAEKGIHGASLDDIASAAGLTKGAVYSNFAGRPTCYWP